MANYSVTIPTGTALLERIDHVLTQHQPLWRAAPRLAPPQRYNTLFSFLQKIPSTDVARLQGDDGALLRHVAPHFADAHLILDILTVFSPPSESAFIEPPSGIAGRKWQQILSFCQGLSPVSGDIIEWCSGKGYLGEALRAHSQHTPAGITGLEIDHTLVKKSNHRHANTPQRTVHCDVLSEQAKSSVTGANAVVALHACGGLHQRMLQLATDVHLKRIALAPCCYHRFADQYTPLSRAVASASLSLSNQDLRLAVRQTVTARQAETQARRQLQCCWLATQIIAAQQGVSLARYRALPHSAAKKGFSYFVEQQCAANNIKTLDVLAADAALARASIRQQEDEKQGLATMLFRRLLELRCVLDSALFLCEHDYRVELSVFCPSTLTPRNFLLNASRH